jgi:hypothetical protein
MSLANALHRHLAVRSLFFACLLYMFTPGLCHIVHELFASFSCYWLLYWGRGNVKSVSHDLLTGRWPGAHQRYLPTVET